MANTTTLKCKACGEWNKYSSALQLCESCKKPLIEISEADVLSLERRKTTGEIKIPINPEDSWIKRNTKHVFNFVQVVFLAVLSFFLWLFAAGPG
jgi:hypothetical protein